MDNGHGQSQQQQPLEANQMSQSGSAAVRCYEQHLPFNATATMTGTPSSSQASLEEIRNDFSSNFSLHKPICLYEHRAQPLFNDRFDLKDEENQQQQQYQQQQQQQQLHRGSQPMMQAPAAPS